MIVLFVLLSAVVAIRSRGIVLIAGVLFWGTTLVLLIGLHLFVKLEAHVTWPAFAGAFLGVLLIGVWVEGTAEHKPAGESSEADSRSPILSLISILILVGATSLSAYKLHDHYTRSRQGVRLRAGFLKRVDELEKGPDHIYLLVLQFPFQRVSPFDTMRDWEDWHFIYTDGDLRSPRYHAFLKEHGISELSTAVYTDPRIHVITTIENVERYATFVKEHRGVELEHTSREMLPFTIFQLHQNP
jgi:hypothetical protein